MHNKTNSNNEEYIYTGTSSSRVHIHFHSQQHSNHVGIAGNIRFVSMVMMKTHQINSSAMSICQHHFQLVDTDRSASIVYYLLYKDQVTLLVKYIFIKNPVNTTMSMIALQLAIVQPAFIARNHYTMSFQLGNLW